MAPVGSKLSFEQLIDAILYKTTKSRSKMSRMQKYTIDELDTMESKLQIAASFLRGARNSLQPIHKLPPELLVLVFDQTREKLPSFLPMSCDPGTPTSTSPDAQWGWLSLVNVCRLWRGVIATSPCLWSTIDTSTSTSAMSICPERFLRRSAEAPLVVYIGVGGVGGTRSSPVSERFLRMLVENSDRIRELHLHADSFDSSGTIYSRLTKPTTNLQSLTILTNGKNIPHIPNIPNISNGVLPPIFNGTMPKLKKLCLGWFTSWPGGYFRGLTHLCLVDQREEMRIGLGEFLEFLEGSPGLVELDLVRAGPTRVEALDTPPPPHSIPPSSTASSPSGSAGRKLVSLPHLRELNLGDWPSSQSISQFLSHLILPTRTDMYIWGHPLTNPGEDLGALVPEDLGGLGCLRGVRRWFFARQPRVILDTPFVAVTGGGLGSRFGFGGAGAGAGLGFGEGEGAGVGGGEGEGERTLYMYGTFTYSQVQPIFSKYPLSEVTCLGLRDSCTPLNTSAITTSTTTTTTSIHASANAANAIGVQRTNPNLMRMPDKIWVEMFECLPRLEELRVMAFRSGGITRAVLGALMPRGVKGGGGGREGRGSFVDAKVDNGLDIDKPSRSGNSPSASSSSSTTPVPTLTRTPSSSSKQTPSNTSPPPPPPPSSSPSSPSTPPPPTPPLALPPAPPPKILCPSLKTLTIEHDLHLPAYFISNVISARSGAGRPVERVKVLVFNERPFAERSGSGSGSASRMGGSAGGGGVGGGVGEGGTGGGSDDGYADTDTDTEVEGAEGEAEGEVEGEGEEFRLRMEDDRRLLERCMRDCRGSDGEAEVEMGGIGKGKQSVVFEYDVPLSMCIVPETWPTRAFEWCRGGYT